MRKRLRGRMRSLCPNALTRLCVCERSNVCVCLCAVCRDAFGVLVLGRDPTCPVPPLSYPSGFSRVRVVSFQGDGHGHTHTEFVGLHATVPTIDVSLWYVDLRPDVGVAGHHSRLREREAPACPGARVVLVVEAKAEDQNIDMQALCTTSRRLSPAFVHACDRWDSYICAFGDQIQNHYLEFPGFRSVFLVCGIPTFKDDFGLIAENEIEEIAWLF